LWAGVCLLWVGASAWAFSAWPTLPCPRRESRAKIFKLHHYQSAILLGRLLLDLRTLRYDSPATRRTRWGAGSAEFRFLKLCGSSSDPSPLVAGHQNAVHGDRAALPRRNLDASGVVVDTRPLPILRVLYQSRLGWRRPF